MAYCSSKLIFQAIDIPLLKPNEGLTTPFLLRLPQNEERHFEAM